MTVLNGRQLRQVLNPPLPNLAYFKLINLEISLYTFYQKTICILSQSVKHSAGTVVHWFSDRTNTYYIVFPGVLNYYPMDCGSVLSVLALNLAPGDRLLDLCSAPGGKALVALQTLLPDVVVCNDISISRSNR